MITDNKQHSIKSTQDKNKIAQDKIKAFKTIQITQELASNLPETE